MENEIRKPRTYKVADKPYLKAKKRAKGTLATKIETWVTEYGNGYEVGITALTSNKEKLLNSIKNNNKK